MDLLYPKVAKQMQSKKKHKNLTPIVVKLLGPKMVTKFQVLAHLVRVRYSLDTYDIML